MSYRPKRLFRALLFVFFSTIGFAQDSSYHDLKIEISAPHEKLRIGYSVTLHPMLRREAVVQASAEFGDTYVFRHVPDGDYIARAFNASGVLLKEEIVRVGGETLVRMDLPQPPVTRPATGTVSMRQLRNPPSKQARRAFLAAQKHSAAGRNAEAAAELEKAILLSPDFALAHTNLAAMSIRLRDYQRAIDETTVAMEIASPNVYDLSNRALAQWALGRYDDAIRSAGQAVRLDANFGSANFVLGSLLAEDPKTVREGIRYLELVAEKYPDAARNLARARTMLQSLR